MYLSGWMFLIVFTGHSQINQVIGFISKATIEAVSIVPLRSNQTKFNGSVAKVSQLFHAKKSNTTRNVNPSFAARSTQHFEPKAERIIKVPDNSSDSKPSLSARFVQKRVEGPIYNRTSNPLISSESWKDLNTILTDEEMKTFLSSLPLHTLRNLTTLTRKNPELGQKQLVRLILDRGDRFKQKNSGKKSSNEIEDVKDPKKIDTWKLSGHKTNVLKAAKNKIKLDKLGMSGSSKIHISKKLEVEDIPVEIHNIHPSNPFATSTTSLPVLEPPTEVLPLSTSTLSPSTESRKNRVFPLPSLDIIANYINPQNHERTIAQPSNAHIVHLDEKESTRQMSSFNSGYYIPPLTTNTKFDENPVDPSKPVQFSWHYQPQDPENTYQPNVDSFLKPPGEFGFEMLDDGMQIQSAPPVADQSSPSTSSAVWVLSNSSKHISPNSNEGRDNNQKHPFSGFHKPADVKLHPAASNDHMNSNTVYENQDPGYSGQEYLQPDGEIDGNPNAAYHYSHSTIDHPPPPVQNHRPYPQPNHNEHKPNSNSNDNPHVQNSNKPPNNNYNQPPTQSHQQQSNSFQSNPEQSYNSESVDNNPTNYGDGGGWGDQGPDFWSKMKTYFNKGGKSTSEKVFEISLAVLSFLAFGGYLLMLIYQVFAVTSVVPLFPFFSSVIPNPSLALFGRSLEYPDSRIVAFGRNFDDKYINEVENIVKVAMDRVKAMWTTDGTNNFKVKGDLGH